MVRNISLDILKIIMACMVVGLHSGFLADISQVGRYITVNGLFRIAVPVFLVINGYFFYSTMESSSQLKWFKRVLSLYIFWTIFYIYFWFKPAGFNAYEIAKVIKTLLVGHNHLWYLPAMLGAAAVLMLVKNLSSITLFFLSIFLFMIGAFIQYAGNYHLIPNTKIDKVFNLLWIYRNFLFFAFPFFCIGYLLKRTEVYKTVRKEYIFAATLLGIIILVSESYFNFTHQVKAEGFDIFISLIAACPLLFLSALSFDIQGQSKSIALYSTAIYFIHPLFIFLFTSYWNPGGTILTFVVAAASAVSAIVLIHINKRFPFIL